MQRRKTDSKFFVPNGAVFGACVLLLALAVALTLKTAVQPALFMPESDFCDYTSNYFEETRHTYQYNRNEQQPIVDNFNRVYICVASKCGITKMQSSFHRYVMAKQKGKTVRGRFGVMKQAWEKFRKEFGEFDVSLPKSNYTKIFVYRNPMSRTISLWNDKFQSPDQLCMTSRAMLAKYRLFRIEILLDSLYDWVMLYRDRHLFPQTELCMVDTANYDLMVDIDDKAQLTSVFGRIWGEDVVNFDSGTAHSTKEKYTDAYRAELRQKIELWREPYTGVYWKDIDFYCKHQGKKKTSLRQM
ncbi:hypothetical protein NDN08_005269 [Rhodosorus marinus]|uniref:Carbohydrate sulfotransferase n=1 Tax=Rhodosorus marinus TaxID=101924 RepID=A0AAV8V1G2_9RHOD|nr:hypothetical protein NDN08_005269 [Rhodosorus marinus]